MAAASFRWILQLHKDVPKAAKLYSEGLDFTINVCTLRWAELQSGSLKLALLHSPSQSEKPSAVVSGPAAEDLAVSRDAIGSQELVMVEWHGEFTAVCKWSIFNFPKVKARALWSKYFKVGGYNCRLLVYPKGDSQALPGYISIYLQIMDPRGTSSSK